MRQQNYLYYKNAMCACCPFFVGSQRQCSAVQLFFDQKFKSRQGPFYGQAND